MMICLIVLKDKKYINLGRKGQIETLEKAEHDKDNKLNLKIYIRQPNLNDLHM